MTGELGSDRTDRRGDLRDGGQEKPNQTLSREKCKR